MPVVSEQDSLNVQDIRALIHGLKMINLPFVESEAKDEIVQMIKALPSTETLLSLNGKELRELSKSLKGIMQLIDDYGRKDEEYAVRYKSKTGLPPRYKIVAKNEARLRKEAFPQMPWKKKAPPSPVDYGVAGNVIDIFNGLQKEFQYLDEEIKNVLDNAYYALENLQFSNIVKSQIERAATYLRTMQDSVEVALSRIQDEMTSPESSDSAMTPSASSNFIIREAFWGRRSQPNEESQQMEMQKQVLNNLMSSVKALGDHLANFYTVTLKQYKGVVSANPEVTQYVDKLGQQLVGIYQNNLNAMKQLGLTSDYEVVTHDAASEAAAEGGKTAPRKFSPEEAASIEADLAKMRWSDLVEYVKKYIPETQKEGWTDAKGNVLSNVSAEQLKQMLRDKIGLPNPSKTSSEIADSKDEVAKSGAAEYFKGDPGAMSIFNLVGSVTGKNVDDLAHSLKTGEVSFKDLIMDAATKMVPEGLGGDLVKVIADSIIKWAFPKTPSPKGATSKSDYSFKFPIKSA